MGIPRRRLPKSKAPSSSKIVMVPPDALTAYAKNARIHSANQVRRIARSISEFGFLGVVVADKDNTIIAGHARVEGAKLAGLAAVPVMLAEHLSEAQRRAFVIADNKLSELSSFDRDILATELAEIGLLEVDFDLTVTGFDASFIELTTDALTVKEAEEDLIPPVEESAVTRLGDLWQLGEHKLLCGDATLTQSFKLLMGRERARLVISDVPYNLVIPGFVSGNGRKKHSNFVQASGELSEAEYIAFLSNALDNFSRFSRDGALHYIFIDHRHVYELITAGRSVYQEQKNIIVWNKQSGGQGSHYRSQHELILLFKSGTAPHLNRIELGKNGRNRTNVWTYPGANSFSATREEELDWHSTVKPLALIADAIIDASHKGDIILDGFGGSGTAIMAAEQTGRRARLIELDPQYCDVTLRRFLSKTGIMPVLCDSGRSFAEVAAARAREARND